MSDIVTYVRSQPRVLTYDELRDHFRTQGKDVLSVPLYGVEEEEMCKRDDIAYSEISGRNYALVLIEK